MAGDSSGGPWFDIRAKSGWEGNDFKALWAKVAASDDFPVRSSNTARLAAAGPWSSCISKQTLKAFVASSTWPLIS